MGGSGLRLHGAESGAAMMEDWTRWLTEEEREKERRWRHGVGPVQRDINPLLRSLAASRALVAAKDKALEGLLRDMHTGSSTVQRLRLARFNGWQAAYVDQHKDCHDWPPYTQRQRFTITLVEIGIAERPWGPHPEIPARQGLTLVLDTSTDDPEEAERLWEEACERLREVGR